MSSILHSLAFNPVVFAAQIVLFIALVAAMDALFWKPVLGHLQARDQRVKDAYTRRDALRQEMEALRSEYLTRIAQVEADARSRIQAAVREAQAERERMLTEAREHAEAQISRAAADLEREREEALKALHGRMATMAITAVGKALGSSVDPAIVRGAVEQQIAASTAR